MATVTEGGEEWIRRLYANTFAMRLLVAMCRLAAGLDVFSAIHAGVNAVGTVQKGPRSKISHAPSAFE
jgi:hypothetical protein